MASGTSNEKGVANNRTAGTARRAEMCENGLQQLIS